MFLNECEVDGHELTLEWVPMMKREMGVLVEDEKKNRVSHVLMIRVYHELRNMINSIFVHLKQNKKKTSPNPTIYHINEIIYFYILLYWSITNIPIWK